MNYKALASCIAFCAAVTGPLLAADQSIARPLEASSTEHVKFASGGAIRFDKSFGDLYVEGWDQPEVEMTLIKSFESYQPPKDASERLEGVQFTTEHVSPSELVIGTSIPPHPFFRHPFGGKGPVTVRYELHVPRSTHLVIHHGGGNILIGNVTGDIEATNREGDIVVMLPAPGPYAIDAQSKMGTVASDFAGKGHMRYFIGDRFASADEKAPHKIFLRTGFGGVTVKEVPREALLPETATK